MDKQHEELIRRAREAMNGAYAPYSKFHVGAAILTDKGEIVTGCNVENVSYGLTICAERVAMCRIVAQNAGKPLVVAVTTRTPAPTTPCGACRQFLYEFNPEMLVIAVGEGPKVVQASLRAFLPGAFDEKQLDSNLA